MDGHTGVIADPARIDAVIFDIDDTLYLQGEWLAGAWAAVAVAAEQSAGVDARALEEALVRIAAEGSDRGGIIDRGLEAVGAADVDVHSLVQAFQAHRPDTLPLLPGVRDMLEQLGSSGVPVALVTDGVESTQESKVAALGLEPLVDHIVMSDRFGRQFRKPHPRPVLEALSRLGCEPDTVVMIGDRPDKDVAAAAAAGVRAIRVRTGEYAQAHDHPFTWRTAADVVAAVAALRDDGFL